MNTKGLIYCENCEGWTEYCEYEVELKSGGTRKVVECMECEHLY